MGNRRRLGLTLVETTAVAGLVVTIVIFVVSLLPSFRISNRRANMELQAAGLARSTLEELKARSFDAIVSSPPSLTTLDEIPYRLEVVVRSLPNLSPNATTTADLASIAITAADGTTPSPLPVTPGGTPMPRGKIVRATVRWSWREQNYSLSRQAVVARVPR